MIHRNARRSHTTPAGVFSPPYNARSLAGVALDALVGGRRGLELAQLGGLVVADVAVAVVGLLVVEDGRVGVALVGHFGEGVPDLRLDALLRVAGAAGLDLRRLRVFGGLGRERHGAVGRVRGLERRVLGGLGGGLVGVVALDAGDGALAVDAVVLGRVVDVAEGDGDALGLVLLGVGREFVLVLRRLPALRRERGRARTERVRVAAQHAQEAGERGRRDEKFHG